MHVHYSLLLGALYYIGFASSRHTWHQDVIQDNFSFSSTIRDTLIANKVIGDVLDDFEPTYYVDVTYPKSHETVLLGNDIPVKGVKKRPKFTFHAITTDPDTIDEASVFTLVLSDPDALSREDPSKSEMCHWIVTNLTAPVVSSKKVEGELESYFAPSPPPKTGPHRYVFVLLKGNGTNVKAPKKRPHWGYGKVRHGIRDWAADNDLTVVGANFFFAQNKKQ